MNADVIRSGVTARLAEARELLHSVGVAEAASPPLSALPVLVAAQRGFFYVSCYGALEFAITQATQAFIAFVSSLNVPHGHLELEVNAVALNSSIDSLRAVGETRRWAVSRAVFEKLRDNSVCQAPDTAFGTFLHNVWPATIEEIFRCFAIRKDVTADPSHLGYLRELVDRRNAVAHGRATASEGGEGKTADDLQRMMEAVYSACLHFLLALEEHATKRLFIQQQYRANY